MFIEILQLSLPGTWKEGFRNWYPCCKSPDYTCDQPSNEWGGDHLVEKSVTGLDPDGNCSVSGTLWEIYSEYSDFTIKGSSRKRKRTTSSTCKSSFVECAIWHNCPSIQFEVQVKDSGETLEDRRSKPRCRKKRDKSIELEAFEDFQAQDNNEGRLYVKKVPPCQRCEELFKL